MAVLHPFGNYMSASGGNGANRNYQHCGGLPGVGSGGQLNIYGGGGSGHEYHWSGMPGGGSFWGGAGASGHLAVVTMLIITSIEPLKGSVVLLVITLLVGARGMAGIVVVWNFR